MGTRIHTVLGYGFKDVKFKNDERFNSGILNENNDFYSKNFLPEMAKLNKERFDKLSKLKNKYDNNDYFDVASFQARVDKVGWYKDVEPPESLSWDDFAKYSGYATECKKSPLVFTHPFYKDWQRFDNIIDYYIFSSKKGPVEKVQLITGDSDLPCNIYPYVKYYDKLTGERVDCVPYDRWARNQEEMAERFGFNSVKEWHENVVPEIPYEIRLFCEVAKIFKNPLTVWELKPMMYVYWC